MDKVGDTTDLERRLDEWAQNEEMINQHFLPHGEDCRQAACALQRQRETIAELRRDAERYRWLRDEWIINGKEGPRFDELDGLDQFGRGHVDDIVDAAIDEMKTAQDAARSAEPHPRSEGKT